MICSSLNLLFFMSAILHGLTDFLLHIGTAGRGQVTLLCNNNRWVQCNYSNPICETPRADRQDGKK